MLFSRWIQQTTRSLHAHTHTHTVCSYVAAPLTHSGTHPTWYQKRSTGPEALYQAITTFGVMHETVTHQKSSYGSLFPNTRQVIIYGKSHCRELCWFRCWFLIWVVLFLLRIFFSCTRLGVYTVIIAGWSSNSGYSLLGGIRAMAQTISY